MVSIAAISAIAGLLLSNFLTARMIAQEARLTHEVIDSIVRVEKVQPYFLGGREGVATDFFSHLELLPDVLRANLYSGERVVLWSSDPALIGRKFADNPELDRALSGAVVANGARSAKPEHAHFSPHPGYFVEVYSPVRDEQSGRVIGVVELYKTPHALFEALAAGERAIWIGAALAGLFLYATLFWLVRRADNLIHEQGERLVQSETLAAIGEMSSAVAHGIRNPLASIRSSAELALLSEPGPWQEAAREIVQQVDRLGSWVRQLLSYSQPLAGKPERVELGALVEASLANFARELERRRIRATSRIDGRLPSVTADALMLGQVFNSLIANAVEAVDRDGTIAVNVRRDGERGLQVSIADSGPGMNGAQLRDAFKPFHTTKPKGMGIGLPLAQRVVRRFGGSIRLDSRPGAGTIVAILLPAA